MGLFDRYKKKAEDIAKGVWAQVNVRDGGKTYDTVSNNKQVGYRQQPQQATPSRMSVGVARPQPQVRVQQPVPQAPQRVSVAPSIKSRPVDSVAGFKIRQAPLANDPIRLKTAVDEIDKYPADEQIRILSRSARAGVLPKNVAAAQIGNALQPNMYKKPSTVSQWGNAVANVATAGLDNLARTAGTNMAAGRIYDMENKGGLRAGQAKQVLNEQYNKSGMDLDMAKGQAWRTGTAQAVAGATNLAGNLSGLRTAKSIAALRNPAAQTIKQGFKGAAKTGLGYGVPSGIAESLGNPNSSAGDYVRNIAKNTAFNAALPTAAVGVKGIASIPSIMKTGSVPVYTKYKAQTRPDGTVRLRQDPRQVLANIRENNPIKRFIEWDRAQGQKGLVRNPLVNADGTPRIGKYKNDPTAALKQEALKYKSAEEFVKANSQTPMTGKATYLNGRNKDIAPGSVVKTSLSDGDFVVMWSNTDGLGVLRKDLLDAKIPKDQMPSPMRITPNEVIDIPNKVSGDVRSLKDKLADAGITSDKQLTDLYNQAHSQPTPKVEAPKSAPMEKTPQPKPVNKEKYSIANSDISRTKSPGMNQDGFTVEDWGGKKRYVSLDGASAETRMKIRKAEAEYEAAKKANNGTALAAKQKVNDAYSDAIEDLKLQDYATTDSGGRTFNSKYNDWIETKYKDRNVDNATIKDMATNPQKYRSQFEAETVAQPKPAPVQKTPTQLGRGLHTNTEAEARANLQQLVDAGVGDSVLADAARAELQRYTEGIPPLKPTVAPVQKPNPTVQAIEEAGASISGRRNASKPAEIAPLARPPVKSASQIKTTPLKRTRAQSPASQPTKQKGVVSEPSKLLSNIDDTPAAISSKEWGGLMLQADTELPTFNAVAGAKGSKSTRKLADAINADNKITQAAKQAQDTGKEINFFAKKDANGRSVGIERFDPAYHRIEAGFVVDKNNNVLGNHIKVDNTGVQVNVGGDLVNMERVLGNPLDWKNKYRPSETISRNIDANAPNKEIANTAKEYLVGSKVKAEANFRTELTAKYDELGERIKNVQSARPRNVSKDQYADDIFAVLNGDKTDAAIRKAYDKPAANAILTYKKETRKLYDELLTRVNAERLKFGQAPVPARKDYITHLTELQSDRGFIGEVTGVIRNSFTDDGLQTTRGAVPSSIAGRTENFKPTSAFNRFMQQRTGSKSLRDPFKAVQEYLEPALYNIHMTEPAARARAVEAAFRTAGELQSMTPDSVIKEANGLLSQYGKNSYNGKLVSGFQEYANALAKKTQRWDRQLIDASDATALGVKGWQKLQGIGGRATILGNVSSTLAQPLNQAVGLADAGPVNYIKGIVRAVAHDKTINQSPFIIARRAKANKPIRGVGEKVLDAGGVPLQKVEMASIEIIWNSQHSKALKAGHKGAKAIQQADFNTERLVAGRGIADKPELYRSTIANGLLQYTLEVMAQHKAVVKDLSVAQKATFVAAAAGMNTIWGTVTGFEPLPDFLGAAIDTGKDFADTEDERSAAEKAVGGTKQMAGEYASMNPLWSAAANTMLTKEQRKSLFGDNSDLGRFDGIAAPVKVVQNAYSAGKNAINGDWTQARNDALRTVPFGNQARKTVTGAEMLQRGYAVDGGGNPTFAAPDTLAGKAQALLFGPSATSNAKTYYGNKQTNIRGASDVAAIENSANPAQTVKEIQQRRLDNKNGTGEKDSISTILKNRFTTPEGKAMLALGTDREKEAQYPELFRHYKATKQAFEYSKDKGKPDNYGSLSKDAQKFYDIQGSLTDEGKDKWLKRSTDARIKPIVDNFNNNRVEGTPDIPQTNEVAKMIAEYESKKQKGNWSALRDNAEKLAVYRNAYKTVLDDTDKYLLAANDKELEAAINAGEVSQEQMDRLIAIDDLMVSLKGSAQISKTMRSKLGYSSKSTSGKSSGSRSSGSSSKASKKVNMPTPNFISLGSGNIVSTKAPLVKYAAVKKPTYNTQTRKAKARIKAL